MRKLWIRTKGRICLKLQMEDPLDLWLLQGSIRSVDFWNSSWISFQLDGKITSRTLVYFKEFELTASGGVEIWYYLVPLSSAQFCLQWFSPTMVSMVRSYNCFASNRRFGEVWWDFAHHDLSERKISSPMVWWHRCFATFSWRSKLEEYLHQEFGLQSLTLHGKKFASWLASSRKKSLSHLRLELCNEGCEASFEFGAMFYHRLWMLEEQDETDLEISAKPVRHWFSFAWTQV